MSELREELKRDFATNEKEYRHAYADENLNASIATQIKVLREQRAWRQDDLAREAEMQQPMISRYENVNYSSWSINTLKKLAVAFDVWLDVRFRSFGELVNTVEGFSRESLQVPAFGDDPFFREVPAVSAEHLVQTFGKGLSYPYLSQQTTQQGTYVNALITEIPPGIGESFTVSVTSGHPASIFTSAEWHPHDWTQGVWQSPTLGATAPVPSSSLTGRDLRAKKDITPRIIEFRNAA